MRKFLLAVIYSTSTFGSYPTLANSNTYVTVEESKITQAQQELPIISNQFVALQKQFLTELSETKTTESLAKVVNLFANKLWQGATVHLQKNKTYDDRALYWARLQLAKTLRTSAPFHRLNEQEQSKLMFNFELASRGNNDVSFNKNTDKKILITGFDPFFLHRNIGQSNPSGIAAMAFDGVVIEHNGVTAEIQTLMVPVRFADFDQGMIETMLTPHIKSGDVDMVSTISMGREDFDLERFPGLRRSAQAPGNLGVYTGATSENPLVPYLHSKPLNGPEFVEFSLPIEAMSKAKGQYKINDNANIASLEKGKFVANSLIELAKQTSVSGSGGGYLSNEISYRSILLRNQYNPKLAVGHIHTPRIKDWDKQEVSNIVEQIQLMLKNATTEL